PNRFGWIVEIDPFNPASTPKKRTALGRKKGECATTAIAKDGRVAVYMGDDQIDHFVFKFVSDGVFNPNDRLANRDLLDHGTLYAARLNEDGTGEWIELTVEA
ncbi:PhoX family protein, partial [Acinetobacter baumannii]|uniref:PhoX family protein n=1 Tax=Acinetobacter baumannii TaxID=470 RepID=UPI003393BE74